jgi:hypothetical protein
MKLSERIDAFARLGKVLHSIEEGEKDDLLYRAANGNAWFTAMHSDLALKGICKFLVKDDLEQWLTPYKIQTEQAKRVGVVMAGNIPMVGFHDLLCVLLSGHHLAAKLSSQDTVLMTYVIEQLVKIEPRFKEMISLVERMNDAEAVIATGSDNTGRYFEYYFRKIPHIIRKNRSSCAVLTSNETDQQLIDLGRDVFSYFGLGCRNVSKLFVPANYDFPKLLSLWQVYEYVSNHHKYVNNYDYNKSILLVNGVPHLDNGFALVTENQALVSPISVLYYEVGSPNPNSEKIQCTVGLENNYVPFGKTQEPGLSDYADRVDTMKFLTGL